MAHDVCVHGGLRRKCDTCDLAEENRELRQLLRGLVSCHQAIQPGSKCGFVAEAVAVLREGDNGER